MITEYESKGISDSKLLSATRIISMVSINNVLALRQSDTLSTGVLILSQGFVYFYFIYVGVLTISK